MAQFTGFTCDDCGTVVDSKDRVKKITRFESDDPEISGEERLDLCKSCAKNQRDALTDVQPLRRRKKADEEDSGTEPPAGPPQAVQRPQTGAPGTSETPAPLPS